VFVIRDVCPDDFAQLKKLAEVLNTVNLPNDEAALRDVLEMGVRSFSGKIADPSDREYLFVMEDTESSTLAGTSMVIARHGDKAAPHIYLRVGHEEHYSESVDAHFRHVTLKVGYDYDGPTEIGALVLAPAFRGHKMKLGKQLSFVRFMFVGMHREGFRDRMLAELLPPFDENGHSALWDALGARFTGLDYAAADLTSKTNKEFIKNLFPSGVIYASLFDERAQKVIGEVGPHTQGAKKMLTQIGFKYTGHIDPFDGGPHYEAPTDELWPVTQTATYPVRAGTRSDISERSGESFEGLVGSFDPSRGAGRAFRATWAHFRIDEGNIVRDEETRDAILARDGQSVGALSFVEHRRR